MSIVERALRKQRDAVRGRGGDERGSAAKQSPRNRSRQGDIEHEEFEVDELQFRSVGIEPPEDAYAKMLDELRAIKRPLIDNAFLDEEIRGPLANLIMVTSATAGAGKSFLSWNLARSIAQEVDYSVLLVDADVLKPQLTRELGLAKAPGLIDVLRDPSLDPESAIQDSDIPRLSFLPCGRQNENAAELLASNRMNTVIELLGSRDQNRITIFDSSPLLETSEAPILARSVGQTVVVVEAGVTQRDALAEALQTLDDSRPIHLVLNKRRHLIGGDATYGERYPYGSEPARA